MESKAEMRTFLNLAAGSEEDAAPPAALPPRIRATTLLFSLVIIIDVMSGGEEEPMRRKAFFFFLGELFKWSALDVDDKVEKAVARELAARRAASRNFATGAISARAEKCQVEGERERDCFRLSDETSKKTRAGVSMDMR